MARDGYATIMRTLDPAQGEPEYDTIISLYHPDDRERVLAVDAESGRTHQPYSIEYRFRRADGDYVWLQEEAVFLGSEPGGQGAWQGLLFDITARKEAEEQLRASELVQSATVEHLPAIVYREPPDGPVAGSVYVTQSTILRSPVLVVLTTGLSRSTPVSRIPIVTLRPSHVG